MITDYQSKYIAYDLTRRRSSDSAERLAVAVAGAQVDMNPHQVDAALFAFASPLSKGALLADEVGLGKTIEAGLVISQRWAEGKRRILIIAPANLRKQWHQEMNEKFFIPCTMNMTRPWARRSGMSTIAMMRRCASSWRRRYAISLGRLCAWILSLNVTRRAIRCLAITALGVAPGIGSLRSSRIRLLPAWYPKEEWLLQIVQRPAAQLSA